MCRCVCETLNTCPGTGLKKALGYEPLFEDDGVAKHFEDVVPANAEFNEIWGNYMKFGAPMEERVSELKD